MPRLILPLLLLVAAATHTVAWATEAPRIRAAEVVEPEFIARAEGPDQLAISTHDRRFELTLEPNPEALEGFDAEARARAKAVADFYRGVVMGAPGSWVRMTRIRGRWTGAWFDGTELYLLDAAAELDGLLTRAAPTDAAVVYRFSDLDLRGTCAVESVTPHYRGKLSAPPRYLDFAAHLSGRDGLDAKRPVRRLRMTLVTDTEFTGIHGAANRDAVVAARMTVVDGIYSNQLATQIGIRHVEHLSSNGALNTVIANGSDGLLNRFSLFMTSGAGSSIPKGGLNHLLTGKDIATAGSPPNFFLAGIAFIRQACFFAKGDAINEVLANNNVASLIIAHEMGHNFDSPHDGNDGSADQRCIGQTGEWLMSPSVNGSSTFSPCTRTIVQSEIEDLASMDPGCFAAPIFDELIFRNGFDP